MWNIIIGIAFIVGGLSGHFALIFTNSGIALVVAGVGLLAWGIITMVNNRRDTEI
jgi:hypothetical protein